VTDDDLFLALSFFFALPSSFTFLVERELCSLAYPFLLIPCYSLLLQSIAIYIIGIVDG
jgi:hypothetical protein